MKPMTLSAIKKIPVAELTTGMVVHDPCCEWQDDSPYRYHFTVADDRQVDQLRKAGASDLYINTALGKDLPGAPTLDDVRRATEAEVQALAAAYVPAAQAVPPGDAGQIAARYDDVRHFMRTLIGDFRKGRPIPLDEIGASVEALADSMLMCQAPQVSSRLGDGADEATLEHSLGVCTLLIGFCQTLRLGKDATRQMGIGGLMHDIGNARVPLDILNKSGLLGKQEFTEIRRHVEYGIDIVGAAPWLSSIALDTIAHHHERHDGSGYPNGLHGDEISMYGQMAAIADVYHAITSERVYHKPIPPAEALRLMHEWSKSHFNAELTQHFIHSIGIYPLRTLVRLDSDLLGIVTEQNPLDLLRPVIRVVYDARRFAAVSPYDINLAKATDDRIQGIERAERWGVDICRYLFN